jgi:hypothetical protein
MQMWKMCMIQGKKYIKHDPDGSLLSAWKKVVSGRFPLIPSLERLAILFETLKTCQIYSISGIL